MKIIKSSKEIEHNYFGVDMYKYQSGEYFAKIKDIFIRPRNDETTQIYPIFEIIFSNGMTIGWMGQNPEFDEESSILKYVCEGKKIEDDYGYESDAKAMLTVLELENFDEKIKNLSGGQKKRAALC